MSNFFPDTGTEQEWNAAYYRLEDYLRALHVVNKVHQSQVILRVLQRAATKHRVNPELCPTTIALEEFRTARLQWSEKILERRDLFPGSGLLPLFLADAPEKWPASFLEENVPPDFRQAVKENDARAHPDLQVSQMVPRPLDASPVVEAIFHDGLEKMEAGTAMLALFGVGAVIALVFFLIT